MLDFFLTWLILSVAVWLAAVVLPGLRIRGFGTAIGVAAVFGVLNFALGWLFWTVFTIGTLGLALVLAFITRWIIDAILLIITDKLVDGFRVDGFGWAVLASLFMSGVGTAAQWMIM